MGHHRADRQGWRIDSALPSPTRRAVLRLAGVTSLGLLAPELFLGCSSSTPGTGTPFTATVAAARAAMLTAITDPAVPSISAALVDGERVIWAEAFGTIDKAAGTPPTTETMFGIGSISKTLAAIATMILVDRGLVDLDAPVAKYVTDFRMASPEYAQITVRMLLNHSSGLPGSDYLNAQTSGPFPGYLAGMRQALTTTRLKHVPGEMAVYCNDGFTLLESVVAAVSGKSFTQFVQDEILTPLGMTHSRYPLAAFDAGSYAPTFTRDTPDPQEYLNLPASGALYSTPSDMGRLAMMLINGGQYAGQRILSPQAVAEMGRDQSGNLPLNPVTRTFHFGLGWDDVAHTGLAEVGIKAWQKGGDSSYHALFMIAPEERLAFFVSSTSSSYPRYQIAEQVLLQALAERGSIASVPVPLSATALPAVTPTEAQLTAIAGYYASFDAVMRVAAQPDRTLTLAKFADGAWKDTTTALKLRSDGTFSTDAEPLTSYRMAETNGRRYLIRRGKWGLGHYLLEFPDAERIEPKAAVSGAWAARIGRQWILVNADATSSAWQGSAVVELSAIPDLPGYILCGTVTDATGSDTVAAMCLKIPVVAGRDLNDVVIETRNAEEWVRIGSTLSRPLATVPALNVGTSAVMIGSEGYAEWRKLPAAGTVTVTGASAWKLYDDKFALRPSSNASGAVALPGTGTASYLLLFGAAGTAITVKVT